MIAAMKSGAATVDAYLAELPEDRRATLTALRALIEKHTPSTVEKSMQYGMPVYSLDGEMLFAFAAQKNYLALYGCGGVFDDFRTELGKLNCGKSCLRFRSEKELPLALAERILVAALKRRREGNAR